MTEQGNHDDDLEVLPPATRIALLVVGGVFLALGLIGLALPVIPQTAFLVVAAAALSLASKRVERALHAALSRWPRVSAAMRRLRRRVHERLRPRRRPSR